MQQGNETVNAVDRFCCTENQAIFERWRRGFYNVLRQ